MIDNINIEVGDKIEYENMNTGEIEIDLEISGNVSYDVDDHGDGKIVIQYWEDK